MLLAMKSKVCTALSENLSLQKCFNAGGTVKETNNNKKFD